MSFIAQVNLADVAPYDAEGVLPKSGLLSFFYDAVAQEAWGSTRPTEVRLRSFSHLPAFAPWESFEVELLDLSRDECLACAHLLETEDSYSTIHRLLGHPEPVQGTCKWSASSSRMGSTAVTHRATGTHELNSCEVRPLIGDCSCRSIHRMKWE